MVHRIVAAVVLVGALVAIHHLGGRYFSVEQLANSELALRRYLQQFPVRSLGICFLAYVLVSLIPGTTGKSLVVAWLFGFWKALLVVNVALTVAATCSLIAARYFVRDIATRRLETFTNRANLALARDGGLYVLLLRLLHVPFTIVNYSLGATTIRIRTFWWATQIGLLPGNIVFVYAGTKLPSVQTIADRGVWSVLTPELILAFVALTLVPLGVRWIARKVWRRFKCGREMPQDVLTSM